MKKLLILAMILGFASATSYAAEVCKKGQTPEKDHCTAPK